MSEQETTQAAPESGQEKKITRKQLLFLVGAVIVAVMFVSSYAAFGSGGGVSSASTSIKQSTYVVFGSANAVVTGYMNSITLIVKQGNVTGTINQTLSGLEANSSINDYILASGTFVIYASKSNPYQLQQLFLSKLPPNSIAVNATERIAIPNVIALGPQPLSVYTNMTNFTLSVARLQPLGGNLTVSVQALVFEKGLNWFIYQNNIQVSEA